MKTNDFTSEPGHPSDPRKDLLLAVVNSTVFQRSARLRDFLLFVGTRTLEGREREVTEHQIGIHVFGKDESFNPAEDNIVRASARMLRVKLREYFDSEGAGQPWRIEIPKGSYVPVFVPAETAAGPPPGGVKIVTPRWVWVALALLALLSGWLGIETLRLRRAAAIPSERETLWTVLMRGHPNLTVVASDSLHAYYQSLEGKLTPFNQYASGEALPQAPPAGSSELTVRLWPLISVETWSHIEDLRAALRLVTRLPERGTIDMMHARELRIQSFRKGDDFLIVGGLRANPWATLFESELNFQMVFPTPTAPAEFHNRSPLAGEQERYVTSRVGRDSGHAYARIAVVPGLAGRGRVVLVAGATVPATDAAGELLLSPAALAAVQGKLGRALDARQPLKLEILLETSSVSGATKDFRIVAVRPHSPAAK